MDVGQHTALGDGDVAKKLVQLLIVPDGELEMTGDDTGLLVVTGGVASQLEDFGSQVLKDGCEVDGSAWVKLSDDAIRQKWRRKLTHQHRHAARNCPSSEDGGHDRLGMRDRPWTNDCDDVSLRPTRSDLENALFWGGKARQR